MNSGDSDEARKRRNEALRQVIQNWPIELRLAGLTPEQILAGLTPEQRVAALKQRFASMTPEQILAELPPDMREALARKLRD